MNLPRGNDKFTWMGVRACTDAQRKFKIETDDIFDQIDGVGLTINLKTTSEEEVAQIHEEGDTAKYTDGSVVKGHGAAAWAEIQDLESDHWDLAIEVESEQLDFRADSFLAEQTALKRAIDEKVASARGGQRINLQY